MIRKDVIIAILATFCLTTTLFMILPTRSGTSAGEYDSWADINDDGRINMYDIGYTAQRFMATGDSTKNVNVANWPSDYDVQYGMVNISNRGGWSIPSYIYCGGRSKLDLFITPIGSTFDSITVYLNSVWWSSEPGFESGNYSSGESVGPDVFSFKMKGDGKLETMPPLYTTEVKAPYALLSFTILFLGPEAFWVRFDYSVYLRND